MDPLHNIVAATDFSAPSRHAAQRAAMLAASSGASLTLTHALGSTALGDLRRWLADDARASDLLEDDARRRLHELARDLGSARGIDVGAHLAVGHPVEQVIRVADELDADLVVTGTRGAGFFRGVVVGSTAERLARRSARPVLMARQMPHEPYRRLLLPVDFSNWSPAVIATALRVAPQATLVLMHAIEVPLEGRLRLAGVADTLIQRYRDNARREAQQRLEQLASEAGLGRDRVLFSTPAGADPWMLVVQAEQEHDCDLVVIGRQGRHGLEEFLLGSTTRMVLAEGTVDVLVACRHPG